MLNYIILTAIAYNEINKVIIASFAYNEQVTFVYGIKCVCARIILF